MANFFDDNEDLKFYVDHEIAWDSLVELVEHGLQPSSQTHAQANTAAPEGPQSVREAQESYRDILAMVGQFTAEQIMPHVAAIDQAGVQLENGRVKAPAQLDSIFAQINELGLHAMCLPRELGGMNCPLMIYFITSELIARADASIMTHHGFHGAIAMAMLLYSVGEKTTQFEPKTGKIVKTRFAKEIQEIITGQAWGCMDITEPDAGSDMAMLSTRARQLKDGSWRLSGQKIFITSGHGKYHFVIARTDDKPKEAWGLEGLSLFLVPTYEDLPNGERRYFAKIDRLEEKLGHHASATCAMLFEDSPAQLVGKCGDGFRLMLLLMNNARLGVGFEALGLCEAAHRLARDYAQQRKSMGKSIDQHEIIADYLDEMRSDIEGIRALAMYGAYYEEIAQRCLLREDVPGLSELEKKRNLRLGKNAAAKSRHVTPLVKFLAAEKAVELARRCLQIHGGVGYTRDYGAEKLLRDSLVTPIYEGTSQIQALMAMKDNLTGVFKNPQAFVKRVAQARWRSLSARDPLERRIAKMQSLALAAVQHLLSKTAAAKLRGLSDKPLSDWPETFFKHWDPKRDFAYAMLHAERLTRLLADAAIVDILGAQVRRHPQRRAVLEHYLERAEPRCRYLLDEMTSSGERLLASIKTSSQTTPSKAQTA